MASDQVLFHSSSRSSASSDVSGSSKSTSRGCNSSVNQNLKLLRLLPQPDPRKDASVTSWCDLYSLDSLRLTLPLIIEDCQLKDKNVFEEFPFSRHISILGTSVKHPHPSPSKPRAHIDLDTLSLKKSYLKLLIKFYENRIHWLSSDSRQFFGLLRGSKVAILVEDSSELEAIGEGKSLEKYKENLKLFVEEQLLEREAVYLVSFGSRGTPRKPEPLPFQTGRKQCKSVAQQWISSLKGEGSCNLLDALRIALKLQGSVDTICVILQTKPDQDLCIVRDYLVDTLSGENSPRLHFVSFNSPSGTLRTSLSAMATETGSHFHSFVEREGETGTQGDSKKTYEVDDSDITRIREEIAEARRVLSEVDHLKHGVVGEPLIGILRELSLTTDWAEDDDFPNKPNPSDIHYISCDSTQWLKAHGLHNQGLDLYKFLAPNAYSQLSGHVDIVDRIAVSSVYDVMPIFTWYDGSIKYLHVDVESFTQYILQLTQYITDTLQQRLQWLLSGSRVPFGTLNENRVVFVLDNSHPVLAQILVLQQHLKLLLEEQLAHVQEFNLYRYGRECSSMTVDFVQPSRQSLLQAWEWILGMSPSGTCDLLSVLRLLFESETVLKHSDEGEPIGVYLVVTAMPDQSLETLCSYIEQQVSGTNLSLHVVYYNMEYQSQDLVLPGGEGGRYGSECEVEEYLKEIARVGRGRFHHFRISGHSEGDDTEQLLDEVRLAHFFLNTAQKILSDYREFCKRNVPPTPPLVSSAPSPRHRQPPPTYPRQTAASLARLNASVKKVTPTHTPIRSKTRKRRSDPTHRIKMESLYTGQGNKKVESLDLQVLQSSPKAKTKPLIPHREFYISSEVWLLKFSLKKLDLCFDKLLPKKSQTTHQSRPGTPGNQSLHRHINHQGEVIDLLISHAGLKQYVTELQTALNRYQSRLEWLHKDCHRYFGAVIEHEAIFLLDVSSSMGSELINIKSGLASMLSECPAKLKRFNIVTFSSKTVKWHEELVNTNQQSISEALVWIQSVTAGGGSCLLEAIKVSLESGAEGIYLLTDGAANHTRDFLISQLPALRQMYGEKWKLNTIAIETADREAHTFLKHLAHSTNGRYHIVTTSCTGNEDKNSTAAGDDITSINKEIHKALSYLKQAKNML